MSCLTRWSTRLGALLTGVVLALVVPAMAWAQDRPAVLAVADGIAARRPRRGVGFGGLLATLCCLSVVVVAVVVLLLVTRGRQRRR
jgi:hypothetical protein